MTQSPVVLETSLTASASRRQVPALLLAIACAALWLGPLGLRPHRNLAEERYSGIARDLATQGRWFHLTWRGEDYSEKPPLGFWCMALAVKLTGRADSLWVPRLPGAIAAGITVLLIVRIMRCVPDRRAATAAAWIFIASPLVMRQATAARLDMMYTAAATAALCLWLEALREDRMSAWRRAAFWLSLAAAFFIKGPVALLILFAGMLAQCAATRSLRPWRITAPAVGLAALLALIFAWLMIESAEYSPRFVLEQIYRQTIWRTSSSTSHVEPVWYYLPALIGEGFAPWSLLAIAGIIALRRRTDETRDAEPVRAMARLALLYVGILSLVPAPRTEYLLPAYPPLAAGAGWYFVRFLADRPFSAALRRAWVCFTAASPALILALIVTVLLGRPDTLAASSLEPMQFVVLIVAAAGFLTIACTTQQATVLQHAGNGVIAYLLLWQMVYLYVISPRR